MLVDNAIDRESAAARIREFGQAAELVRRNEVELLKVRMNTFYERGGLADVVALSRALDWQEHSHGLSGSATFVEALLAVLGLDTEPL